MFLKFIFKFKELKFLFKSKELKIEFKLFFLRMLQKVELELIRYKIPRIKRKLIKGRRILHLEQIK
jgi:hypothetical protein